MLYLHVLIYSLEQSYEGGSYCSFFTVQKWRPWEYNVSKISSRCRTQISVRLTPGPSKYTRCFTTTLHHVQKISSFIYRLEPNHPLNVKLDEQTGFLPSKGSRDGELSGQELIDSFRSPDAWRSWGVPNQFMSCGKVLKLRGASPCEIVRLQDPRSGVQGKEFRMAAWQRSRGWECQLCLSM